MMSHYYYLHHHHYRAVQPRGPVRIFEPPSYDRAETAFLAHRTAIMQKKTVSMDRIAGTTGRHHLLILLEKG